MSYAVPKRFGSTHLSTQLTELNSSRKETMSTPKAVHHVAHHATRAHHALLQLRTAHARKLQHVAKHSRVFLEVAASVFTAIDTHLVFLSIVSITWAIVDLALIVTGVTEL